MVYIFERNIHIYNTRIVKTIDLDEIDICNDIAKNVIKNCAWSPIKHFMEGLLAFEWRNFMSRNTKFTEQIKRKQTKIVITVKNETFLFFYRIGLSSKLSFSVLDMKYPSSKSSLALKHVELTNIIIQLWTRKHRRIIKKLSSKRVRYSLAFFLSSTFDEVMHLKWIRHHVDCCRR